MSSGALSAVLEDAKRLGHLGPDPVDRHIEHALAWSKALTPGPFLDLGSGGGVPGLVLAELWPGVPFWLLDSQLRRTAWLRTATARLELSDRATILEGRAEDFAHDPALREQFALITSRAFGSPSATAECASGLLTVGGHLTVSEPPDPEPGRWPEPDLVKLGLTMSRRVVHGTSSFVILTKTSLLPSTFPRRRNLPSRDPLW